MDSFQLQQNYPNPFNPSTVIRFQLPVSSQVELAIYTTTGQLVRTLARGDFARGEWRVPVQDRGGELCVAAEARFDEIVSYGMHHGVIKKAHPATPEWAFFILNRMKNNVNYGNSIYIYALRFTN